MQDVFKVYFKCKINTVFFFVHGIKLEIFCDFCESFLSNRAGHVTVNQAPWSVCPVSIILKAQEPLPVTFVPNSLTPLREEDVLWLQRALQKMSARHSCRHIGHLHNS